MQKLFRQQKFPALFDLHMLQLETFKDPNFYDMWAVRPLGHPTPATTIHFLTEEKALWAADCIGRWMSLGRRYDEHDREAMVEGLIVAADALLSAVNYGRPTTHEMLMRVANALWALEVKP